MNIDNGHLVSLGVVSEGKDFDQEMQKKMASYFAVPPDLLDQAKKELPAKTKPILI